MSNEFTLDEDAIAEDGTVSSSFTDRMYHSRVRLHTHAHMDEDEFIEQAEHHRQRIETHTSGVATVEIVRQMGLDIMAEYRVIFPSSVEEDVATDMVRHVIRQFNMECYAPRVDSDD